MEIIFHYPPELLQLLIDAIPKLCKSKSDLLLFFQGSGVSKSMLQPFQQLLLRDKALFNKYTVTREVLARLNEQGESSLRVRRELLKRVTEFEDFSVCWENDRAAARGLVAQICDVINVKDSFTRMRNEKDKERQRRLEEQEVIAKAQREQKANRDRVKSNLFALFGVQNAHRRGKLLEQALNDLFAFHDVLVRDPFTIKGNCGEGVIEQ
ncbi:MAG TPA: restriction endonuclease, partial [Deltaproteobacteria bacterium]|nr:restriction endonuclease [Deltaproteobacteria bacterium]